MNLKERISFSMMQQKKCGCLYRSVWSSHLLIGDSNIFVHLANSKIDGMFVREKHIKTLEKSLLCISRVGILKNLTRENTLDSTGSLLESKGNPLRLRSLALDSSKFYWIKSIFYRQNFLESGPWIYKRLFFPVELFFV